MTKVKLYILPSCASSRKTKKYLVENGIDFDEQHMIREPLSWEQLLEILMKTDNGVSDIISERSMAYRELVNKGVDFEELTLTELHEIVQEHPRIVRSPIAINGDILTIGYNDEEISSFNNRADKREQYLLILEEIREQEDMVLAAGGMLRETKNSR